MGSGCGSGWHLDAMPSTRNDSLTTSSEQMLDALLVRLIADARDLNLASASVPLLLAVLLETPGVAALLRATSPTLDIQALRTATYSLVRQQAVPRTITRRIKDGLAESARLFASTLPPPLPSLLQSKTPNSLEWSDELTSIVGKSILLARATREQQANASDLLVAITNATGTATQQLLGQHAVNRYTLTSYLAHGGAETLQHPPTTPTDLVCVYLLNDDYTPMVFVAETLETIFGLTKDEADRCMQTTHREGRAACGSFPFEVAQEKILQLATLAKASQHPLRATLEWVGVQPR